MKHRSTPQPLYPYSETVPRVETLLGTAVRFHDAPETTAQLVREQSGPKCVLPTQHGRYVVFSVSGYQLTPGTFSAVSGALRSQKTWSVLDSANNWEEVARFYPSPASESRARSEASRLNALDRKAA